MRLQGVFLPVTTPFDPRTGALDASGFRENLRGWFGRPIAGVVVGGSTGEAPLLEPEEFERLVAWAREEAGTGLVIAGTGAESTAATIRLSVSAAEGGADAVLVRPPAYYRDAMTDGALHAHYTALADASPVPVLLYNIPRYVPVELAPELVRQLVPHPNIVGVKDSSGDLKLLGALADACHGKASLLVGSGAVFYGGLEVGAAGGILAVALLAPEAACRLHAAWGEEDGARAGRLQERIGPLHRAVVGRHGVPGVKHALDLLGLAGGPPRPPLRPLTRAAARQVERALVAAGALEPETSEAEGSGGVDVR